MVYIGPILSNLILSILHQSKFIYHIVLPGHEEREPYRNVGE